MKVIIFKVTHMISIDFKSFLVILTKYIAYINHKTYITYIAYITNVTYITYITHINCITHMVKLIFYSI